MLPDFLANSYKKYKQDTTLFTTWLAKAAKSAGYKPRAKEEGREELIKSSDVVESKPKTPEVASGRLKGKDRKAAKAAKAAAAATQGNVDSVEDESPTLMIKYSVTTEELLRQAEAVVGAHQRSGVRLPRALRYILLRAIRARQRCAEWFRDSKIDGGDADKGHSHFIQVLQQCMDILEPCLEEEAKKDAKGGSQVTSRNDAVLVNRFEALNMIEGTEADPSEVYELTSELNAAEKSKGSKGVAEVTIYEIEGNEDFDDDLAFLIYCFFEDLHRTQDYLGGIWQKYKCGAIDLCAAAVTTNAAYELVRQGEEDLLDQFPNHFDRKRSWDTIAILVFYKDAFDRGICPEARLNSNETLRITPFDDFIYLSTARILMKFTHLADLPEGLKQNYPALCQPLRFGYVSRPELLGTPDMDRREEEDRILSQYIIDRQLWSTCNASTKDFDWPDAPLEDEFSIGLDDLTNKGKISVALVFEARVFLDIHQILGADINKGRDDLVQTAKTIDTTLGLKVVDDAWDVGGSGERWHERDVDSLLRIKKTSIYYIFESPSNAFPWFKKEMLRHHHSDQRMPRLNLNAPSSEPNTSDIQQGPIPAKVQTAGPSELRKAPPKDPKFSTTSMKFLQMPEDFDLSNLEAQQMLRKQLGVDGPVDPVHEETARRLNLRPIEPSEDLYLISNANPIYCGLVAFNLLTDFETAGIALCNWHKSIWPSAHLYNALQRKSAITKPWPEMEELTDFHMDTLFSGSLPLSETEIFVRCGLALGLPMSDFVLTPRRRNNTDRPRSQQGANGIKLEVTQVSKHFRQYFENKTSLETCLVSLEKILRKEGATSSRKSKNASKRRLSNLQFLGLLEKKLPILEEHNDLAIAHTIGRGAPQHRPMGPQLQIAADETNKFLRTYRPQDLISNFNSLPRPRMTPSGLVPNHWNISIRHVKMVPPGDLVFFVQPDSHYIHQEGPIQTAGGQVAGHKLNPKSLVTLQIIAKLIMKAFVEGMEGPEASAPHSWATNDPDFARRIIKVMKDMGVREDLMEMKVAETGELTSCDEDWNGLFGNLMHAMA